MVTKPGPSPFGLLVHVPFRSRRKEDVTLGYSLTLIGNRWFCLYGLGQSFPHEPTFEISTSIHF
uniref:Putative ovule protein n=1 Tax=Solanum chacoense TaxID=4108 RepID=A0A0V0GGJ8_SOLCH